MEKNEKKLLEKIKNSDNRAFREIFDFYHPVLYKFIFIKTQNKDLSLDIAQETFLKVWLNRNSLKTNSVFISYLFKIASNLLKDHYKWKQVRIRQEERVRELYNRRSPAADNEINLAMLEDRVNSIITDHLPKKCREIFILNVIEDKTIKEIAEILDISAKTVKNQLYKALKITRKKLSNFL